MIFLGELPKWKKVALIVLSLFIAIRIGYILTDRTGTGYYTSKDIILEGTEELACKNIIQTFTLDNKRLNSIELAFNEIAENETGVIIVKISSEDELLYQTNISLNKTSNREWKKIFVNLRGKTGKIYEIELDAYNCVRTPNILLTDRNTASPEVIGSYAGNTEINSQVALKYVYFSEETKLHKIKLLFFCMLWLLGGSLFLYYFEFIYYNIKKICDRFVLSSKLQAFRIIFEIISCSIIVCYSGVPFASITKIVFFFVSVCSLRKVREKKIKVKEVTDKPWKRISLYVLYIYSAFSLVGQRLLIYPLNLEVTIRAWFIFFITILWFIPIIDSLIYVFGYLGNRVAAKERKRRKTPYFIVMCIILLLLPACINLYANNPGISTKDTVACMVEYAHNLRGMRDWHPAFYCMVLKAILSVWDSTYAVIFLQYFFWIYVVMEGILFLRKKQVREGILLITVFLFGISPANFLHLNTIWKDIPYTLSLFWSVVILGKLTLDFEEYKKKWYIYLELFISLIGVFFYRKNGIVPFILITITLLIFMHKNKKLLITLAITMVAIVIIKGPIYSYFQIENVGRQGIYIGLSQDILGVYYAGGEISEETLKMINVMTYFNNTEYEYIPTWSGSSYALDISPTEFIKNYLHTFIKNPLIMTRAVIAREDLLWNIYPGKDSWVNCVNCTITMDDFEGWNAYYPKRIYNDLYPVMKKFTTYSADDPLISVIVWRCGVLTLLAFVAAMVMVWDRGFKRYLLIEIPLIGHIFSLLLSTGWTDFRYFWPINLINAFLLLFMFAVLNKGESGEE